MDQWGIGMGLGRGGAKRRDYEGALRIYLGDGCVHYLDCGDAVYIHKSKLIKLYTLIMCSLLQVNYPSI